MLQSYLVRGLKAGLVAGLAFGLFVALLANPMIGAAEELAGEHDHVGDHDHGGAGEDAGHHAHSEDGLLGAVSTDAVSVLGGVFWASLLGVAAFGLVFYFLEPAIPGPPGVQSALVAAGGFVTISGAPWLVLPPQPPGVEQALSVDTRLVLSVGLMVAGFVACLAAGALYTRFRARGRSQAFLAAGLPLLGLVSLALLAPANPVTGALPDSLVAAFRAQVLFGQVLVWGLLAGVHARLLGRESGSDSFANEPAGYERSTPAD